MEENRITIKDIAEELGLSSATVSNVIHGKTKKVSEKTVEKVQEKLESSGYIPNMAAVLLARNSSEIVCVVLSDDLKYDSKMIEDPFVSGMLNGLSKELSDKRYFMMLKEERNLEQIIQYASMWNMAGLILMGYCEVDYDKLRSNMHIPFVVIDAYSTKEHAYSTIEIDNKNGGYQVGKYLLANGHSHIMYLADNKEDCDYYRYWGLAKALKEENVDYQEEDYKLLSFDKEKRIKMYDHLLSQLEQYSAAFCASDVYAIEFMNYLLENGVRVPEDFSIIGFDDILQTRCTRPALTTVRQDFRARAKGAVLLLEELVEGKKPRTEVMQVHLVVRDSVKNVQKE